MLASVKDKKSLPIRLKFCGQFWLTRGPVHLSRVVRGLKDLASEDGGQLPARLTVHQIRPLFAALSFLFKPLPPMPVFHMWRPLSGQDGTVLSMRGCLLMFPLSSNSHEA